MIPASAWLSGTHIRRMSRASWNFATAVRVWWSGGDERSGLLGRGLNDVGWAVPVEVALDRDGELRQVAVTDDAAELPLGLEHPGCGPAQCHVAGLPALHVARRAADALDHPLAGVRCL